MSEITVLCSKILKDPVFTRRFKHLEHVCGKKRLHSGDESALSSKDVTQLLLHGSVLALSDNLKYKQAAQKISSLLYELYPGNRLVAYGIQSTASRLGNFPVSAPSSTIFGSNNLFSDIKMSIDRPLSEPGEGSFIDSEIVSNMLFEEEVARYPIGEHNYYFNSYQLKILDALSSKKVVSFSAPTSFGKSFIIRNYIARQYKENRIHRCLIVVPTKALIDDFFSDMVGLKTKLGLDYSVYSHARSVESATGNSVFILTQERLSFLLQEAPDFARTFDIVYCDEAHYIARGYRGFVLRSALRKLIDVTGATAQYIFTSPIIKNPGYYRERLLPDVSEELVFHDEIRYSPVEKNVHIITQSQSGYSCNLLHEQLQEEAFADRIENIVQERRYNLREDVGIDTEIYKNVQIVNDLAVSGRSIIYVTSPTKAHEYGFALTQGVHARLENNPELDDLIRYVADHYGDVFGLADLLKKGIGLHYGPMPIGLRKAIVELFEKGNLNYLICTSTLLEGVNLPAKNMFVFSDKYGGASGKEKHSVLSFWNLVGRAGRMTYGLSGNVFCVGNELKSYEALLTNTETQVEDPENYITTDKTRRNYVLETFLSENKFRYKSAKAAADIEYFIFELLTGSNTMGMLSGIAPEVHEELIGKVTEAKQDLHIPLELLAMNPGVDPRLQDTLFRHLQRLENASLQEYLSIVDNPRAITGRNIDGIVSLLSRFLLWPKAERKTSIESKLIQWLHEQSVAEFIRQNVRHCDQSQNITAHLERVNRAIKVIHTLESECSFNAPRHFKCFFDIVLWCLAESDIDLDAARKKTDSFLLALESGITSAVGRYLFEKGVSRPVAIKVNSILGNPYTVSEETFQQIEVLIALGNSLSRIAFQELREHLDLP